MARRCYVKYSLDCTRDAGKSYAAFEECPYRDFVCCIECDASGTTSLRCLIGQLEARKTGKIGLLKVQLSKSGQVKGQVTAHSLGITHGVKNWQPHIGNRDLGQDAAVDELHQQMDGRLRVYR